MRQRKQYSLYAEIVFGNSSIQITTEGHKQPVDGTDAYKSQFITSKINQWITEFSALSEFVKYEPHAAFAAFTHGLRHRYTFMMRTVLGISNEFKPLDDAIDTFIRGYRFSFDEREMFALPAKLGGLGIIIPSKICDTQYSNSRTMTEELTSHVTQQNVNGSVDTEKLKNCND